MNGHDNANDTDTEADPHLAPRLDRLQRTALIVGAAGLALSLLGAWISPKPFYQAYLIGYLFWVGIALGCIGLLMLHHLVGGAWGFLIRRLLEAGAATLWLMALLFVPIALNLAQIYPWARPSEVAHDALLRHKSPYLNVDFFLIRAGIYFVAWIGLATLLRRWSFQQDRTDDPRLASRLERISGPGLAALFLTASFSAIDWVMSLEPHWYSTIFGAMLVTGQALTTLAFMTAAATLLSGSRPLSELATPGQFNDLGNLLLAFVMLWAYMAFSQFLIIWSGNLVEDIPWYLTRTRGGWQWVALALIVFHFFLPFFALLFRETKRKVRYLLILTGFILVMRLVDLFWLVAPSFRGATLGVHWLDPVAPVGIGGLWLAVFAWQLKSRPLLPRHDPRLAEVLEHAGEHAGGH